MKIEELKQKSQIKMYSHGAFGENETYYKLDPDKFAKLIIEECIEVFKLETERYIKSDQISQIQLIIKKHFNLKSY